MSECVTAPKSLIILNNTVSDILIKQFGHANGHKIALRTFVFRKQDSV